MARQVKVLLVCDKHTGEEEVVATQTVTLQVNGKEVELDLCDHDGAEFYAAIDPWLNAGRAVSGTPARGGAGRRRRDQQPKRDNTAIRDWARSAGIEVSDRGRIPQTVVEKYDAAH
jgi:hypothetical protein